MCSYDNLNFEKRNETLEKSESDKIEERTERVTGICLRCFLASRPTRFVYSGTQNEEFII